MRNINGWRTWRRSVGALALLMALGVFNPALGQPEASPSEQSPAANAAAAAAASGDSCVDCHVEIEDEAIAKWPVDIHNRKGILCVDCHGGNKNDPEESAMDDEETNFKGTLERRDIPPLCATCHADPGYMRTKNPAMRTDQHARYQTSVHGALLAKGDEKVATCVDCHGVHGILPVKNVNSPVNTLNVPQTCGRCHASPKYMASYKLPTDQVEQYRTSVHGKLLYEKSDLSAPVCNDCHGNHGAFPPEVTTISDVCGQCHVINRDSFVKSPHKAAFAKERFPECSTCHGNHGVQPTSDLMLGADRGAVCSRCHDPGSKGYDVAKAMRTAIDTLKEEIKSGARLLEEATHAGVEVSRAQYEFRAARISLIQARNVMHEFNLEEFNKVIDDGLKAAQEGQEVGRTALAEAHNRKLWVLWPILGIVLMLVGLIIRIRDLDEPHPPQ